jgi:2'-5' RNA ligase
MDPVLEGPSPSRCGAFCCPGCRASSEGVEVHVKLTALFGKKASKVCPCCNGIGEHKTGFECYLCDSGGDVPEHTPDDEVCDGSYEDGGESHRTATQKQAAEDSDDPGLIHRGLSVVLPKHIHDFVHDENQPAGARAHMLLAHVRKAKPEITSEEAKGTTGGLGNYWSPRKEKAAEYGDQGGWKAYHDHEREHDCGDSETGYGGCPSTHVVLHAGTPPEKHHWTENFRDGEKYDPEVSWRLPVRPDSKLMVHGISWKQGHDNESGTHRDFSAEKAEPYSRYDFLRPMRKRAALDPAARPHQAATAMAQKVLREQHPEVGNPLPYSEQKASQRLQGILEAHGHPGASDAFVMRHEEPGRGTSQVVHDADTGAVGVALHDKRYDYGTLAHEAGHILDIHRQGMDVGQHHEDDVVHGDGFRQGYHDALHHLFGPDVANTFTRNYRKHLRLMKDDPSRYKVSKITFGPGADEHIGEDEYDPDETWEHKGLWDRWHPQLQPTIHRHLAVEFPSGHPAHDKSAPVEDRARAVVDHVSQKDGYGRQGKVGWHWTDDPNYKHLSTGNRMQPGQTKVTLHAQTPPREHIEDADWLLQDRRGVRDWDTDPEREVPVKRNAPVKITGVSWDSHDGPQHHTFDEPITRRAAYVPPGTMGTDSQGHGVQMTTMDGWAHRDGSHGHEDGPDVGQRPVYTKDHTWLPNGRYWGPNSAQNDQRLFEGDHLRPEVRQDILDRVGGVLGAYDGWEKWTRVYFAGSEAAQWQPFNGDFDILIGIDFEEFRDHNPRFEEMEDAEIANTLTEELWTKANAKEYYFTLHDGRSVGPFDRTFFVSPRAWDIKALHPYAAYNVTSDDWAVHPLQVPKDWDARRLPESYWGYAEALLAEIKAIGQLPPEERHRMAANLWEELHSHRSDAFSDGGHGLFDLSNIVEKYLDQHPDHPWEQLVQWKNESPSGTSPWVPTTARRTTLTELFDPKTAADGADYGGVMIAIVPPKDICEKLAQEDGEPVEAMHITLAYMPGQDRRKAARVLPELVEGWARTQKAMTARIGGVGTFVNPGQHVLWAAVDIPHGGPFRQSLVETLERHEYEVANDHGWTPHITLDYRDHHVRFLPKVEPVSWDVTEVMVCIGDNWTAVPLG